MGFTRGDRQAFPGPEGGPDGMTMREWYAGQALASMPQSWTGSVFREGGEDSETAGRIARAAFAIADAMLAESRRAWDEAETERRARQAAPQRQGCHEPGFNADCPVCRGECGPVEG